MSGKREPKVLVVGAGPVGLASAITLNQRGIPLEVVERDDRTGTHSYALALHPGTVDFLNSLGVDGSLESNSVAVRHVLFCDREGPQYDLDLTLVTGSPSGLLVLGQDRLESALLGPLEAASVPIHWSHRLAGVEQGENGVDLELESLMEGMSGYAMARLELQVDKQFSRHSDFVIGADGHFSMIRRRLGIDFAKVAPTQSFAVFEFKTDYDLGDAVRVVFSEEGTSVLWPLPGGYCRWGFEIDESAAAQFSRDKDRLFMQVGSQGFSALESGMFDSMIQQRAPWFDGSVGSFRWRMIVRFENRLADSYGQKNIWLAGDSAHLAAPIGMQSMNLGIAEGIELSGLIADIIEGKAGPEVLDAYGARRHAEWHTLMGLDASLKGRASTNDLLKANLDKLLGCLPASLETLPKFIEAMDLELVRA